MAEVLTDILNILDPPLLDTYEIDAYVMGFHVYKTSWKPFIGEELSIVMEPDNVMDRHAAAVIQQSKKDSVGHLPLCKTRKFTKTIFYFLKADKENSCKVFVTGKAVN